MDKDEYIWLSVSCHSIFDTTVIHIIFNISFIFFRCITDFLFLSHISVLVIIKNEDRFYPVLFYFACLLTFWLFILILIRPGYYR